MTIALLKGIRVMLTVLVFVPVSWIALIQVLGTGQISLDSKMPGWFIKSFERAAGMRSDNNEQ